jgi:hypothetical protein
VPAVPRSRHHRLDQRASPCPVWHQNTRQPPPGHRELQHISAPAPASGDSTPILIDRVRRKRQRLRSNGSIESDPASRRRCSRAPCCAGSLSIESYRLSGPIQTRLPSDRARYAVDWIYSGARRGVQIVKKRMVQTLAPTLGDQAPTPRQHSVPRTHSCWRMYGNCAAPR